MKYDPEALSKMTPAQKRELLTRLLRKGGDGAPSAQALSYAQKSLWFLYRMAPESTAYNVEWVLRIWSEVDAEALRDACQALVNRHSAFRTVYGERDGAPFQRVLESQPVPFHLEDATGVTWETLSARLAAEARRPFDLERGPILRVSLFRRATREYILLLVIHHIACDLWCLDTLIQELRTLYLARKNGITADLPRLEWQYTDFVHWQSEMLAGPRGKELRDYWQAQLQGDLPVVDLPIDHRRSSSHTFKGDSYCFQFEDGMADQLRSLARAEGTTLFTLLLAVFHVFLHRYSGAEDVLVASPVAGRGRPEFEGIVGYFVNPLVFRADLSGDPPFRQLLARVRQTVLEGLDHQDYPLPLLVEQLQVERDHGRAPLTDIFFVWDKPRQSLVRPGLAPAVAAPEAVTTEDDFALEALSLEQHDSPADLALAFYEFGSLIGGGISYRTDLFEQRTIERVARNFTRLLQSILENPDEHLSELRILSESEEHLIRQLNGHAARFPQELSLHGLFEVQAARTPDRIALVSEAGQLSYRELNRRANQMAHHLRGKGVGPGDVVGVFMERSAEMIVAVLGILKAGAGYLPLDPLYPEARLSFMLQDAKAAGLVTQQDMLPRLPAIQIPRVIADAEAAAIAAENSENPGGAVSPDALAYVIYTSGSTGEPKGVMVPHSNVARLFGATEQWFHFHEGDVWTLFHSIAFDFSVWEIWGALLYGGRLVIVPFWVSRSPEMFYDWLSREKVTILNQTPSAFRQLVDFEVSLKEKKPLALRKVIFGGEALDFGALKPWFEIHGDQMPELVNMYGITETTVHVTYRPIAAADAVADSGSLIGRPIPDLELYVLDRTRKPVPIGVPGELYVGGVGVALGYLGRPELTAGAFIQSPFQPDPAARLYKTGDLVRYRADGDLEYLGRIDNQVQLRGFRVELGEIESALRRHESVSEAAVVARNNRSGEMRLVAFVAAKNRDAATEKAIRAFLRTRLPEYMVPSLLVLLDALPLTRNGKIDRRALPDPDTVGAAPVPEDDSPKTEAERILAGILAETLGVPKVGRHDNFFDLGGHSLLAARAVSRVREALKIELPLPALFDAPTPASLAERIQSILRAAEDKRIASGDSLESHEEIVV